MILGDAGQEIKEKTAPDPELGTYSRLTAGPLEFPGRFSLPGIHPFFSVGIEN